jgi:signal peptidase I
MADPADSGLTGAGPRRRRPRKRTLIEMAVTTLVAVLVAVLLRAFAFETFYIPSASMVPTLGVYDRILVQKAFFTWHDVREGDIVVFSHPPLDHCPGPQGGDLVKRVIALPGQPPIASSQHPYRVPPGEFYVLGDNRADSCDSRYWGPIKGSSIVGQVVLMLWHDGHPDFHGFAG